MPRLRTPALLLALLATLLAPSLLSAAEPGSAAGPAPVTSREALRRGNRLYRRGDLEGAVAAYRAAAGHGSPLLAYNLATALHHLGRLPEAVLWYRRAATGLRTDPWIEENLARARAELGARRLGPPRLLAPLLRDPWLLPAVATGCAWAALLVALAGARRRSRRLWRLAGGLLAVGLGLWSGELALSLAGPRPAVVLEACGELPAGSEVWVLPATDGRFRILEAGERCDGNAVGLIEPP